MPVLGVFYGTSLIADEVEDKTITYLFTRPIPRGAVLLGKYLAYLVCTVFVVLPSVVIVWLLHRPDRRQPRGQLPRPGRRTWACSPSGLAVYGAVFALVGAALKRPLLVGLVFVLGWEPLVMALPGYLKRLTVAYYLQGLVPHAMPSDSPLSLIQELFRETPSLTECLFWITAIEVVCLWLAARRWRGGNTCSSSNGYRVPEPQHPIYSYNCVEVAAMTQRTRYFLVGSALVVVVGSGHGPGGLHYNGGLPFGAASQDAELVYLPADVTAVAYADVRTIMSSEFSQKLREVLPTGEGKNELQRDLGSISSGILTSWSPALPGTSPQRAGPWSWCADGSTTATSKRWRSSTALLPRTTTASGCC